MAYPRARPAAVAAMLLAPLNIYIIGSFLGTGIQCALFRYQQTYLGSNWISLVQDIGYVTGGHLGGRTAWSIVVWCCAVLLLVLAVLLAADDASPRTAKNRAGYAVMGSGVLFLLSCAIQYGPLLHGPGGISIPVGIPMLLAAGWWMQRDARVALEPEPPHDSGVQA
ncbi:MAG: hypothetical protein QMD46_07585 [Methanomicrobiales archaeon]|nr:hypothetical protein [Methanomicrobiales archaeon]